MNLTAIATTGAQLCELGPYVPSIDDDGAVAFWAGLAGGESAVFVGRGGGLAAIARAGPGSPLAGIASHPAIAGGQVCFYASDGGLRCWRAGALEVVARPGGALAQVGPLGPTMDAGGRIAYRARLAGGGDAVFAGDERVADTRGEVASFEGLPVATDDGAVVYRATMRDGRHAIVCHRADATSVVAETGGDLVELGRFPAAKHSRDIVCVGRFAGGGGAVLRWRDGRRETVVDTGAGFESFRGALVDGDGGVVFYATPTGGTLGVYAGGARVLGVGDRWRDTSITELALNPVSINRAGQLAVRVALADGAQAILRADR